MFSQQSLLVLLGPLVGAGLVSAQDPNFLWQAPLPTDLRSPCPMVNSLANHGYLPRDGVGVSLADLTLAFSNAVNLDPAATMLVGLKALDASTTGDPLTFNLNDLNTPGVLEHDGSLSRNDIYFGDNYSFNETIYNSFFGHFAGSPTIDVPMAAAARKARLAEAEAANPEYSLGLDMAAFSMIETALYLSLFSNGTSGVAVAEWVDILFREERLPFEEGFKRSEGIVWAAGILLLQAQIALASLS